MDDSGDALANTGTLTATTLTGLGMSDGIDYAELESLNIDLGSGADGFTIASTHLGSTTLNTHAGDDTVNLLSNSGETNINTGSDQDTVNDLDRKSRILACIARDTVTTANASAKRTGLCLKLKQTSPAGPSRRSRAISPGNRPERRSSTIETLSNASIAGRRRSSAT